MPYITRMALGPYLTAERRPSSEVVDIRKSGDLILSLGVWEIENLAALLERQLIEVEVQKS